VAAAAKTGGGRRQVRTLAKDQNLSPGHWKATLCQGYDVTTPMPLYVSA
jgi:hypothetical protein